jgi:hypothetical protein
MTVTPAPVCCASLTSASAMIAPELLHRSGEHQLVYLPLVERNQWTRCPEDGQAAGPELVQEAVDFSVSSLASCSRMNSKVLSRSWCSGVFMSKRRMSITLPVK